MRYAFLIALALGGCVSQPVECPPKSDTQVIADTVRGILVPSIEIGGCR